MDTKPSNKLAASAQPTVEPPEKMSNLDNCYKVLTGVQEQIRFADTKAAFVSAINTLMFGFVASSAEALKKGRTTSPAWAWVGTVALVIFGVCSVLAMGMLIYTVMSRFGEKAPKCRIFFGHIASQYGHDFEKYVTELKGMTEDVWLKEVGTQIVETSHIAVAKHKAVRTAAHITIVGLVCWAFAVLSISLIS